MRQKTKTVAVVAGALAVLIVGVWLLAGIYAKSATKDIMFQTVDAVGVADDIYDGLYEIAPVKASVRVTVEDEKITSIDIREHQTGLGGKAEAIADDVIRNQSLEVDAISGATVSSNTILKAIENALQSGEKD
ncbi:FMN-binding protein [Parasphaerochaeta coccoides]|uniref:FMN-binding domain protein n=1 Tax=Parasphaerochaeta coccoides (strain ATCC BAA-1237 / DSM 17374 / SPN1) TaxID=760011 RepID=F4GK18_PARC1|nr:FMN-binding protein [Parasphaerochaeta coccoides]AEC01790.1 FMN-binding domain protein [Parasphaerochaeta coccoides DSM 17374]